MIAEAPRELAPLEAQAAATLAAMRQAECALWSASRHYEQARAALLARDVTVKARVAEAEQLLTATAPASLQQFMTWLQGQWTVAASAEYVDALDAAWRAARRLQFMESAEVIETAVVALQAQLPTYVLIEPNAQPADL